MSHKKHDYTKYSQAKAEVEEVVIAKEEAVGVETTEIVEEVIETVEEAIEEVAVEATIEEAAPVIGVVTDCFKLNVRVEPSIDTDIACVLTLGAEVKVDLEASTSDFYKVTTEAGVEGYCIKTKININA